MKLVLAVDGRALTVCWSLTTLSAQKGLQKLQFVKEFYFI